MIREFLDDARWFDSSSAQCYKGKFCDRAKKIRQWLYHTRKRSWILEELTGEEHPTKRFRVLQERQAFAWLMRNGYVDNVPAQFIEANEI